MSAVDRTLADYQGTGMTVGPHIMAHLRAALARDGVLRAVDLRQARDGQWVKIAGLVIVRQRPGTAKGFCFLTLEDETGTANAVVVPSLFQRHRAVLHTAALLQVEGPVQKIVTERNGVTGLRGDGVMGPSTLPPLTPNPCSSAVIHVRARRFVKLDIPQQPITLTGRGYRMRVTPGAVAPTSEASSDQPNNEQPNNQQPVLLPKSHDFR